MLESYQFIEMHMPVEQTMGLAERTIKGLGRQISLPSVTPEETHINMILSFGKANDESM